MALLSVLKVSGSCEGNVNLNADPPARDAGASLQGDAAAEAPTGASSDADPDADADGSLVVGAEAATDIDDASSLD